MSSDVLDETLASTFVEHLRPEDSNLGEIILICAVVASNVTGYAELGFQGSRRIGWPREAIGEVVRIASVIGFVRHRAIALIVQCFSSVRTVHR